MSGVHRIVEAHAASRGNDIAVLDGDDVLTYRDLNLRSNALARYLIDRGLRRGSRAAVKMDRGVERVIAMLAVMKAGAAYTCLDVDEPDNWSNGITLLQSGPDEHQDRIVVSSRETVDASSRPAPNLPIVTRGHDIACVMPQAGGTDLLVPHGTIVALQSQPLWAQNTWVADPGALDVWIPLMAGASVVLTAAAEAAAA
jgi:non-ribosomal peptide synthetase component F